MSRRVVLAGGNALVRTARRSVLERAGLDVAAASEARRRRDNHVRRALREPLDVVVREEDEGPFRFGRPPFVSRGTVHRVGVRIPQAVCLRRRRNGNIRVPGYRVVGLETSLT